MRNAHTVGRAATVVLAMCALGAPSTALADGIRRNRDRLELPQPVRFEVESAVVLDLGPVDALAEYLVAHPEIRYLEVRAHTDDVGAAYGEYAARPLWPLRARAIVALLIDRGVAADRLRAVYRGAEEPLCDPRAVRGRRRVACRSANRRIELVVVNGFEALR